MKTEIKITREKKNFYYLHVVFADETQYLSAPYSHMKSVEDCANQLPEGEIKSMKVVFGREKQIKIKTRVQLA